MNSTSDNEMTDEQLISYCEMHCKTERALFNRKHVARMVALAGLDESLLGPPYREWFQLWEDMEKLCTMAREQMIKKDVQAKIKPVVDQAVQDEATRRYVSSVLGKARIADKARDAEPMPRGKGGPPVPYNLKLVVSNGIILDEGDN